MLGRALFFSPPLVFLSISQPCGGGWGLTPSWGAMLALGCAAEDSFWATTSFLAIVGAMELLAEGMFLQLLQGAGQNHPQVSIRT